MIEKKSNRLFWLLFVLWMVQTVVSQVQKSNAAAIDLRRHNEIMALLEGVAEKHGIQRPER